MAYEFRCNRRVEFAETDMAGIVHFSNFFRYMETAEHEFLRWLGLSVHTEIDGRLVSWPRVRAECSYRAPVRFDDELEIRLMVREKRERSITYDFRFWKGGRKPVAHGSMTVVCVAIDPRTGEMSSIAIPSCIDEKIEAAPAELIEPLETNRSL
jgi:acyl-CoA thioester hydrolase